MTISKSYGLDAFGSTDVNTWRTVGCYGCKASYTNYPPSTDGWGDVIVFESLDSVTIQLFHPWNKTELLAFRGTNANGVWGNWQTLATTSDLTTALAGYLKNTGEQKFNGVFTVGTSSLARIILENAVRKGYLQIHDDGRCDLNLADIDGTNIINVFTATADGANTFNGTATGNLALDALSFSTTAPSNTSALWVDTANKVIKAYIDGAWTQVS